MKARWIGGALLAAIAAGPMVATSIVVVGWMASYASPQPADLASLPLVLLFSILVGWPIAQVPALAASGALFWAGSRQRWLRNPIIWAATGYATGWLLSVAAVRDWGAGNWMLGLIGACCALLARWRTRWSD